MVKVNYDKTPHPYAAMVKVMMTTSQTVRNFFHYFAKHSRDSLCTRGMCELMLLAQVLGSHTQRSR
jgi:hypothetical protein